MVRPEHHPNMNPDETMHAQHENDDMQSGNGPDRDHPWDSGHGAPWLDEAQRMAERARDWVMDNPLAAVGVALTTGFLVGRIARRIG